MEEAACWCVKCEVVALARVAAPVRARVRVCVCVCVCACSDLHRLEEVGGHGREQQEGARIAE